MNTNPTTEDDQVALWLIAWIRDPGVGPSRAQVIDVLLDDYRQRRQGAALSEPSRPQRGDQVERWLKTLRDGPATAPWAAGYITDLLDDYRWHAAARVPLGMHGTVEDCMARREEVSHG